jgi:hypothetical protein
MILPWVCAILRKRSRVEVDFLSAELLQKTDHQKLYISQAGLDSCGVHRQTSLINAADTADRPRDAYFLRTPD